MELVDAQQARRILDRLVGYKLSPLLWEKVRSRLSAGRVQSVALRLVVEREREIRAFVPQEYWTVDAEFLQPDKPPAFRTLLVKIDGEDPELGSEAEVESLLEDMRAGRYAVLSVKRGSRIRRPSAPFTTSTMQQRASRNLRYTARRTMVIAQQLYEGVDLGEGEREGLITYMRTDSTQVSQQAVAEARSVIRGRFGEQYLPKEAPQYRTKARRAQEAHEAIRPTSTSRTPESLKPFLSKEQFALYSLIWKRFVASQMRPAEYDTMTVEVEGKSEVHGYRLRVAVSSLRFPGFLEVYGGYESDEDDDEADGNGWKVGKKELVQLPDLQKGDPLRLLELYPEQHFTQPPRRYSDASLIRTLEEHGIGRPSTYAPIISTLRQRGYIVRRRRRLIPNEIGEVVTDLLVEHFPDIVDLNFTARMEEELDEIADGDRQWVEVVREFYLPFEKQLERAEENMPEVKAEPEEIGRACPECGHPLLLRHGRYGKFIGCSNFPACRHTEPWLEKIGVTCPQCGGDLVERRTRRGRVIYGCANYPDCEFTSWKRPLATPCPQCGGLLVVEKKGEITCTQCGTSFARQDLPEEEMDAA